jgi:hypothetical protein
MPPKRARMASTAGHVPAGLDLDLDAAIPGGQLPGDLGREVVE